MKTSCDYCGLPLPPTWWPTSNSTESQFCCYGCRFAAAIADPQSGSAETRRLLTRLGLAIFFAMNVMAFTMALWTQDIYAQEASHRLTIPLFGLFRYLCLFFSLPVFFLLGIPLWESTWEGLTRGQFSTDLLLLLGVISSYLISAVSVFRDEGPIYFEVGCMVLVLVTLGRWLEARGKCQATQALESLEKLLPENVHLILPSHEGEAFTPLSQIVKGDLLRIRAGERIPCDGMVKIHPASVDEQLLTGEAGSRVKEPGDSVFAGTLNIDSDLFLEVQAGPGEGAMARLVQVMRKARLAKGSYERLADSVSRWFLPLVVLVSIGTGIYHSLAVSLDQGILSALAVVLIACPCALGIATPLAVWAMLGKAARHGVLFQSGEVLERLARIQGICFDKTGTLTTGDPHLKKCTLAENAQEAEVWERTLLLATGSNHALSQAIIKSPTGKDKMDYLKKRLKGLNQGETPLAVQTLPGRGVAAKFPEGEIVWLGSGRLMREKNQSWPKELEEPSQQAISQGNALVALAWGGKIQAFFEFMEEVRPEVKLAIQALKEKKLSLWILTGDHRIRAEKLAQELDVPVAADLLPEDKLTWLCQKKSEAGMVAMVGDGINDGPALAASDVGIALGCGADVARASAGICLLRNNLQDIPRIYQWALQTVTVIRQNLFWAFGYNLLGIGLACTGKLTPVWAAVAMVLSSFLVISNSMRLSHSINQEPGGNSSRQRLVNNNIQPKIQS